MFIIYVFCHGLVGVRSFSAPSERAARKKAEDIGRRGFWLEASNESRRHGCRGTFVPPAAIKEITISRMN